MTDQTGSEIDPPLLQDQILSDMTGGSGGDVVGMLVEGFLEEAADRVTAIDAAIAESDASTAGFQAHALKSVARTYGAIRLGELAAALETAARGGDCADIRGASTGLRPLWQQTESAFRERFLSGTSD